MNAREALHYLAAFPAPEDRRAAVHTLSAALDERDALRTACETAFNYAVSDTTFSPTSKAIAEVLRSATMKGSITDARPRTVQRGTRDSL